MDEQQLEETLRSQRSAGVLAAAKAKTGKERVAFLKLAVRKIAFGSWPSAYLDDMIALGDAAVAAALELGEKEEANIVCFNMSANLCDCWGDAFIRERRHFEQGLAYADRALAFRGELGKPADKVAMAHWARGKHLLSLGRYDDAAAAFQENVNGVKTAGLTDETLMAGQAYLGLARAAAGDKAGKSEFERAMQDLAALKASDPKKGDDVQSYVDQLTITQNLLKLD